MYYKNLYGFITVSKSVRYRVGIKLGLGRPFSAGGFGFFFPLRRLAPFVLAIADPGPYEETGCVQRAVGDVSGSYVPYMYINNIGTCLVNINNSETRKRTGETIMKETDLLHT